MIYDNADDDLEERFRSLLCRYQIGLKTSMEVVILSLIVFIYCITNVIK